MLFHRTAFYADFCLKSRLLVYDPAVQTTTVLLRDLNFANGVAVSHDQTYVLVNETGSYRVTRYWIAGRKKGTSDIFLDALPGLNDSMRRVVFTPLPMVVYLLLPLQA